MAFGLNLSTPKYSLSNKFIQSGSFSQINVRSFPFISLQPVCNIHLGKRRLFDLRFVVNFSLSQRNFVFTQNSGSQVEKIIESAYLGMPVLLKYKSTRHNNWRFFVIGGAEYAFDFQSKKGAEQNYFNPDIAFAKHNYYYTYGCGFDLYFRYFKLSPQLRIAKGLNDVLVSNPDAYSQSLHNVRNQQIMLSFFFE